MIDVNWERLWHASGLAFVLLFSGFLLTRRASPNAPEGPAIRAR
jgi:hypothetical protein